jgi:hypothetical protein
MNATKSSIDDLRYHAPLRWSQCYTVSSALRLLAECDGMRSELWRISNGA